MKKNYVTKENAVPKYDSNAVCGVMNSSGPAPGPGPVGAVLKGRSTRYWDCCKVTYSTQWSFRVSSTNYAFSRSHHAPGVERRLYRNQSLHVHEMVLMYLPIQMFKADVVVEVGKLFCVLFLMIQKKHSSQMPLHVTTINRLLSTTICLMVSPLLVWLVRLKLIYVVNASNGRLLLVQWSERK